MKVLMIAFTDIYNASYHPANLYKASKHFMECDCVRIQSTNSSIRIYHQCCFQRILPTISLQRKHSFIALGMNESRNNGQITIENMTRCKLKASVA